MAARKLVQKPVECALCRVLLCCGIAPFRRFKDLRRTHLKGVAHTAMDGNPTWRAGAAATLVALGVAAAVVGAVQQLRKRSIVTSVVARKVMHTGAPGGGSFSHGERIFLLCLFCLGRHTPCILQRSSSQFLTYEQYHTSV